MRRSNAGPAQANAKCRFGAALYLSAILGACVSTGEESCSPPYLPADLPGVLSHLREFQRKLWIALCEEAMPFLIGMTRPVSRFVIANGHFESVSPWSRNHFVYDSNMGRFFLYWQDSFGHSALWVTVPCPGRGLNRVSAIRFQHIDESLRYFKDPVLPLLYQTELRLIDTWIDVWDQLREGPGLRSITAAEVIAAAFPDFMPLDPWGSPLRWMFLESPLRLMVYSIGPDQSPMTLDDAGVWLYL